MFLVKQGLDYINIVPGILIYVSTFSRNTHHIYWQTWFLKFMWTTLVQGHLDYCSQLYFPCKSSDMGKLEDLQRIYSRKIPEVSSLNYWERLQKLKMYSQERRVERYRAIYIWKILEGISPNCGIQETFSEKRGREVCQEFEESQCGRLQSIIRFIPANHS
jgi:hypothetical protein